MREVTCDLRWLRPSYFVHTVFIHLPREGGVFVFAIYRDGDDGPWEVHGQGAARHASSSTFELGDAPFDPTSDEYRDALVEILDDLMEFAGRTIGGRVARVDCAAPAPVFVKAAGAIFERIVGNAQIIYCGPDTVVVPDASSGQVH